MLAKVYQISDPFKINLPEEKKVVCRREEGRFVCLRCKTAPGANNKG